MGASVSSNVQKQMASLSNKTTNSCRIGGASNVVKIDHTTFDPPEWCKDEGATFEINQGAALDATCVMKTQQTGVADLLSKLNSKTITGLGFNFSQDYQQNMTNISSYLDQQCNEAAVKNVVNIDNSSIHLCKNNIIQKATAKDICRINALQKTTAKIYQQSKSDSEGGSIFGVLFGSGSNMIIFIIVLVLLAAAGFGIKYMLNKNSEDEETESEEQTGGFRYYPLFSIVIIIISVIVFIIIGFGMSKCSSIQIDTDAEPCCQSNDDPDNFVIQTRYDESFILPLNQHNLNENSSQSEINESFKLPLNQYVLIDRNTYQNI